MPYRIPPLQSDNDLMQILKESNQYLDSHKELADKIQWAPFVLYDVQDLLPVNLERMYTGYLLPASEAATGLENSIQSCKLGFYKQALIELRSALEMGLLSVYWELDGDGHVKMQNWLRSNELTPKIETITSKLITNQNFKEFDDAHKFCDDVKDLYKKLSPFAHTRGMKHSHWRLARSNVNRFNAESFLEWSDLFFGVVRVIVTAYVLKYPVALQHTPLYQKFGLEVPLGTCLDVDQSGMLKRFLDDEVLKTLQAISDADYIAVGIAQHINDLPDLTEEQHRRQEAELVGAPQRYLQSWLGRLLANSPKP